MEIEMSKRPNIPFQQQQQRKKASNNNETIANYYRPLQFVHSVFVRRAHFFSINWRANTKMWYAFRYQFELHTF